MKNTTSKAILEKVKETEEFIETIKEMSLAVTNNKTFLKAHMAELKVNVLGAGDHVLVITDRSRRDPDKDMIRKLLGEEKYAECQKIVEYQTFEIKKAAK